MRAALGCSIRRFPGHPKEASIPAFRFIHTADIHLDSPLKSLALRAQGLAELVGNATRQAFTRIIDICLEEQVDALLIAGDLYDGDQTSMKTARFLAQELKRLDAAGIRCFIIRGNHDHLARITKELTLPDSVTVFGGRAGVEMIERPGQRPIAIHGLSFSDAKAPESLLPKYKPAVPDAINIGLLHTSLGGSPGHDAYAPCSVAELVATGFDYWALGHIHMRSVVEGRTTIVMPGMPQGRDINEAGPKSVTLVTMGDDGSVSLAELSTSRAIFMRRRLDITGTDDWRELLSQAGKTLLAERPDRDGPQLVTRLLLTGATPLAWRIRRDMDLLQADLEQRVDGQGVWVERIESDCRAEGAEDAETAGSLAALERIARDSVLAAESFKVTAGQAAEELLKAMPPELKDLLGTDEATQREMLATLAAEGVSEVLAHLRGDGTGTAA